MYNTHIGRAKLIDPTHKFLNNVSENLFKHIVAWWRVLVFV